MGLRGVTRRRFRSSTERDPAARPAPDLVERDFHATRPNQLWVADITELPMSSGRQHLAVILDVWSRRVVGWSMASHKRAEVVQDALSVALATRSPEAKVIHHSDQGSQYTSSDFRLQCKAAGVTLSMGSVGDAYDNALCESFFATLKCELTAGRRFSTAREARREVFAFIDGYYNTRRLHSALNYQSPLGFEKANLPV